MRVVVDITLLVSAALKERSVAGTTVHIAAEGGVLLKSTMTSESRDHAAQPGAGDPTLLRRARVFLGQYADHHRLRRGGRGCDG
jgi:hypothetical protein